MIRLPPVSTEPLRERIRTALASDEQSRVGALLQEADTALGDGRGIVDTATGLIEAIRRRQRSHAGISALLNEFSLSSREGVVLMCLAEALLRVPDSITADRLIRDKIGSGDWRSHVGGGQSLFVNASSWGLLLTGKVIQLRSDDTESAWRMLRQTVGRAGEPAIRAAMRLAMKIMGTQFVLGTTIEQALDRSREWQQRGYRYSYDMLGEGARADDYAEEYFEAYCRAIGSVGRSAHEAGPVDGPGFSVKLSALHPRMELGQSARLSAELVPRVLELARIAKIHDIGLTIDAEEAHRLDLTLDVFEAVYQDPELKDWEGLGIAVQAYLRSAPEVIDWVAALSARHGRRIMVRLVKGAYWDAEIKHAQVLGLDGYPVFTRKASSDLAYLVCAKRLLDRRDRIYPQFATHNAHSAAAVLALAGGDRTGFEFQRLHGMGEELYEELEARDTGVPTRIYAPVGVHQDLLAYLVRRLLENGANSSFVHNIADENVPAADLAADPRTRLRGLRHYANRSIRLPPALFGTERANSRGVDLMLAGELRPFAAGLDAWRESAARLGCDASAPGAVSVRNPADRAEVLGHYPAATATAIEAAITTADAVAGRWAATPVAERAASLLRAADAMEGALAELVGYCVKEAGKTPRDALADVREAIDFCRYYAVEARRLLDAHGHVLGARGPILCISPWNFPVAIFTGQVAAALVAGNPVIAKPAEQTTLVALRLVQMFHDCGIPPEALQVLCGPGEPVGARLLGDPRLSGVMFTGSTEVARLIDRALAAREGPRAMLIAETGGQNALVVDSTALPEQVVDDVIASGFNSAGQRCSALRLLYVQDDIADGLIEMLKGAMAELGVGDPASLSTDVGPIIDEEARERLEAHAAAMKGKAALLHVCGTGTEAKRGCFFAPRLYEIDSADVLQREVFGPVVHLLRYKAAELEQLPARINASGYGLTFGIHSRIQSTVDLFTREVHAGNIYVNRNIIGAVVGVQPFGGQGLSGTGPKAGGPLYLGRLLRPAGTGGTGRAPITGSAALPQVAELLDARSTLQELVLAQPSWGRMGMRERFSAGLRLRDARAAGGAAVPMIAALLEQATALAQPREMPGPTGESNTLSFGPRGVMAVLCREGAMETDVLLPALAALLAGNTVLFVSDAAGRALVMQVREALADAGFGEELSAHQVCGDFATLAELLVEAPIAGVACQGDAPLAALASRALAARDGAILPLIEEDFGPLYLTRFVHEKTVSVNTTASGGNAALMSQSESD